MFMLYADRRYLGIAQHKSNMYNHSQKCTSSRNFNS